MFAVRQVCDKYIANGKGVFLAFMYLEKAYDTIDGHSWYVADAKSVWSWWKIVESSAEFFI